jgi:hypothetical protein
LTPPLAYVTTRYSLATDISLAALTGDGVFNFGEVLSTPILHVLTNTPNEWLSAVLKAFDAGYDHGRENRKPRKGREGRGPRTYTTAEGGRP